MCYADSGAFQKLQCGHSFCPGCIKNWYLKGTGTGCPMCRQPIYFRGFHVVREEWEYESWENKCTDIFNKSFDDIIESTEIFMEKFPKEMKPYFARHAMNELRRIECVFRVSMCEGFDPDEMDYLMNDIEYYISERKQNKWHGPECDPILEKVPYKAMRCKNVSYGPFNME